jgi:organic radical activating enzyme
MDLDQVHKLAKNSDSFCVRPYHERIVRGMSGLISPCCKVDGFKINSGEFEKFLADQENGVRRPECHACWADEAKGVRSHRQLGYNEWNGLNWHAMEVYFKNTCDLACIYCNQTYSSRWGGEIKENFERAPGYFKAPGMYPVDPNVRNKESWDLILNETRKLAAGSFRGAGASVTILGGEPLIQQHGERSLTEALVETFFEVGHPDAVFIICIQTNGNTPEHLLERVIQKFKEYKAKYRGLEFSFGFSFESTGRNYNFVRYGGSWETLVRNMVRLSWEQFELTVQTSINSVALTDLTKFLKFTNQFSKKYRSLLVRINPVHWPKSFGLSLLDRGFTRYVDEALHFLRTEKLHYQNSDDVISGVEALRPLVGSTFHLDSAYEAREMFEYFKNVRQQDISTLSPELHRYFQRVIQEAEAARASSQPEIHA